MSRVPIELPELGAAGEPVRVTNWLVEPGEEVEAGERLVEVLVRGITFDVSASVAGVVVSIVCRSDSVAQTGDVLGWIASPGDDADSPE